MSYIITATVDANAEENIGADKEKVDARILKESGGIITFDIPGKFGKQKALTAKLCATLLAAGFISFEIHHSY